MVVPDINIFQSVMQEGVIGNGKGGGERRGGKVESLSDVFFLFFSFCFIFVIFSD